MQWDLSSCFLLLSPAPSPLHPLTCPLLLGYMGARGGYMEARDGRREAHAMQFLPILPASSPPTHPSAPLSPLFLTEQYPPACTQHLHQHQHTASASPDDTNL